VVAHGATVDATPPGSTGEGPLEYTAVGANRLASEDVIINAPMSYAGSGSALCKSDAREPRRLGSSSRHVPRDPVRVAAWFCATVWYLLGPVARSVPAAPRGAERTEAEANQAPELMGTIQGSAAASRRDRRGQRRLLSCQRSNHRRSYSPSERIADAGPRKSDRAVA